MKLDIAAQERARIAGQAGIDRGRQRAHARDHGDAQSQTAEEDAEAGEAAPQLAPREAPGENQDASRRVRADPAIDQRHDPVAAARQLGIVGNQQKGRSGFAMQAEQQIDDLLARGAVEIAGRLVRQQQFRAGDEGARDGDALLLAARKLRRVMQHARRKTHGVEPGARRIERIGAARQFERQRDVLQAVMVGTR